MITTIYNRLYFSVPSSVYQVTDDQEYPLLEILGTYGREDFILAPAYWLCCSIDDYKNRNIGLMSLNK